KFEWKSPTLNETGEGRFLDPTRVEIRWTASNGSKQGPLEGTIDNDGKGHVTRMSFANGVVLTRVGAAQTPPATLAVPDVKGWWQNQLGQRYVFGTNGTKFAWKFPTLNETGEGRFLDPTHVEIRWTASNGSKQGPLEGTVDNDGKGRATRMSFANGVVLTRAGAGSPAPAPALDLTGTWQSNYGKVDLKQQGTILTGTVLYPNGATGTIKGSVQGQTVTFTWSVNPALHGQGTLTISPDGKRLEGPVTDDVSKVQANWVLTR
ncbi:MAG: hypothetical protein ACC662_06450, partial [Planctomycetota bacterium]